MKISRNLEDLPDGMRTFLEHLKREVQNTPPVNKAALLGTLIYIIIDVINKEERWIMKYARSDRLQLMKFFIRILSVYVEHLTLAP
jgi:hypothetical protein